MRGFAVIFLMVMMLALLAPMTAMADVDTGNGPVLAITMDKWSDVVTAKAIMGQEQPRPHQGKTLVSDGFVMITAQAIVSARVIGMTTSDISATAQAIIAKAGGAAIFASGKPRFAPVHLIAI